jgi:signal transduction histidine kinase
VTPRSLRGQLMLAFTLLATLVVLAAAVGVIVLLRQAVWGPLDAALAEEAETLATLHPDRTAEFASAVARIASETEHGGGKFIRVFGADGRIVARGGSVPHGLAITAPVAGTRSALVSAAGGVRRVVWYPAPDGGWTEIGIGVHGQLRMLRRATLTIAAAALAMLASLVALASVITRRATRELARLATELESVEAGSLDRRLAPRHTAEIDRLAGVLNRLLARLDAAVGHLRRFTADAAHELRTPIAALRAHIEVTLARGATPQGYREGLADALEQTERLGKLAADLLTLSAVESGGTVHDAVRLDVLAHEVTEILDTVAQEQGRRFTCDAQQVVVRGAPDLLKRLIVNLVDNAFRHTPPTAAVRLSVHPEGDSAAIVVSDGGDGMPAAEAESLFQRFRRGRTAAAGSGLGLAICREIASRHGGGIVLRTAPGAGTTVTVTLPLLNGAPA